MAVVVVASDVANFVRFLQQNDIPKGQSERWCWLKCSYRKVNLDMK
jgi:hypothetical protein